MLGMGRERVVRVPVDAQGRMLAGALPQFNPPSIVCVQVGNVNTGSFDPVPEICRRAHESGAWVHVDGAFGLWAAASPRHAHLVAGVADADSWATDAHKWLNVPYDSGLAFVRDAEHLRGAMSMTAAYLPQGGHREPLLYVPELSRRARGVDIWAALKSLGRSGLAELIDRNCRCARRFADGLAGAGFEILNDVVLNQVLVSFGTPEDTSPRDRGHSGGRHLLVRPHAVAGTHGDAHQRLLLGDHGGGCGPQSGSHAAVAAAQTFCLQSLLLRHFDHEVSELFARVQLDLVRDLRGDRHHVARGEFLFRPALDRGAAHFVGRGGLAVHQFTAHHQRGLAALHHEDVGLRGMIFGFAGPSRCATMKL